jgi:hypothetical protein
MGRCALNVCKRFGCASGSGLKLWGCTAWVNGVENKGKVGIGGRFFRIHGSNDGEIGSTNPCDVQEGHILSNLLRPKSIEGFEDKKKGESSFYSSNIRK